jgi:hypothetical protein
MFKALPKRYSVGLGVDRVPPATSSPAAVYTARRCLFRHTESYGQAYTKNKNAFGVPDLNRPG